jgi:hypothetical protein
MHLLLPASGFATRMSGMLKFMLPLSGGDTLIKKHIEDGVKCADVVHIATRSVNVPALASYLELNVPEDVRRKIRLQAVDSVSMTDTVMQMLPVPGLDGNCVVMMPDTYFPFDMRQVMEQVPWIGGDVLLVVFRIRPDQRGKLGQVKLQETFDNRGRPCHHVEDMVDKDPTCEYEYAWGAVVFCQYAPRARTPAELSQFMRKDQPHIGYAVKEYLQHGGPVYATVVDAPYFDCGTIDEYTSLLATLKSD